MGSVQMVFEFFRPTLGITMSKVKREFTTTLWAIDICSKIEEIIPEYIRYIIASSILTKTDLKSIEKNQEPKLKC